MCLVWALMIPVVIRVRAPWLSQLIVIRVLNCSRISPIKVHKYRASFAAWVCAMYLASVLNNATMYCFLELHVMAPLPKWNEYPDTSGKSNITLVHLSATYSCLLPILSKSKYKSIKLKLLKLSRVVCRIDLNLPLYSLFIAYLLRGCPSQICDWPMMQKRMLSSQESRISIGTSSYSVSQAAP